MRLCYVYILYVCMCVVRVSFMNSFYVLVLCAYVCVLRVCLLCVRACVCVCVCVFTEPSARAGCGTRSISKRSLTGSVFSFS